MSQTRRRAAFLVSWLASALLAAAPAARIPPVDVNAASETELMTVPGITRPVARRIIEHRPYPTMERLIVDADLPLETVRVARGRLSLARVGAAASAETKGGSGPPLAIDVNHAPAGTLVRELGMTEKAAQRAVAARPFQRVEQFLTVSELPPEKIRLELPRLTAGPPRTSGQVARSRVFLPGEIPTPAPTPAGRDKADVNAATAEELRDRCGLDPMNVNRIIQGRPYRSLADMGRRLGFEHPTVVTLSHCLRVGNPSAPPRP